MKWMNLCTDILLAARLVLGIGTLTSLLHTGSHAALFDNSTRKMPSADSVQNQESIIRSNFQFQNVTEPSVTDWCLEPAPIHLENTSAITQALPSVINAKTVSIAGVFTVDQNLKFVNCSVFMRPGSMIIISPGTHLQIQNTDIEACGDMWDGIYLNDASSKITVLNAIAGPGSNHHISHSVNGIVLSNGAQYSMTRAKMIDNYHHLQIVNFADTVPNNLTGCLFSCNPQGIGKNPHYSDITRVAISIRDVQQVYIGWSVPYLSYFARTRVEHAKSGIEVKGSSVEVNNLDFTKISTAGIDAASGTIAGTTANSPWIRTKFGNTFNSMPFGIRVDGIAGSYNSDLCCNDMGFMSNTGIAVWNCPSNRTFIHGNQIHNPLWAGIWVYSTTGWLPDARVLIDGNKVEVDTGLIFSNTGIYVNAQYPPGLDRHSFVNVKFNTISNCFSGIYMVNVPDAQAYHNYVKLNSALVQGVRGTGIFGYQCPTVLINSNQVSSFNGDFLKSKVGVGIDKSPRSDIYSNEIHDYGDGIFISGDCYSVHMNCNSIYNFGRGIVYNHAVVGQQGSLSAPQGNRWFPSLLDGKPELFSYNTNAALWDFYYQSNAGPSFIPAENMVQTTTCPANLTCTAMNILLTGDSSHCYFQREMRPMRGGAEHASGGQIQNSGNFNNLTRLSGNEILKMEHLVAELGNTLVDSMLPAAIGAEKLAELIAIDHFILSNDFEGISTSQWVILDSIASSKVKTMPEVVSAARAMKMYHDQVPLFNWVEDDSYSDTTVARFKNDGKAAKAIGYEIQVYPIPADELMTISNPLEESLLCVLVGLDGKEVHRFEILHGENELNVSNFPAGVYFLNVNGKSYSKTVKVVIE